jgi:hypothetical protein
MRRSKKRGLKQQPADQMSKAKKSKSSLGRFGDNHPSLANGEKAATSAESGDDSDASKKKKCLEEIQKKFDWFQIK